MNRILLLALLTFHIINPPRLHAQNEEKKRNIVFILIDDQRFDFLSFLDHPWIKTPYIDRLASQSLYFHNAFVTTSLCSPSRASILTGQYAHAHQVIDNDTPLPKGIPSFASELQNNGYHTSFIGKWHMGGQNDMPRAGFDYWASFKGQGSYFDPKMNINGERLSKKGYTPDILTELACDYIRKQSEKDEAYCLFLSHKSIHEPFSPAERHRDKFKDLRITRPASFAASEENYEGKPGWLKAQRKSWHGAERDFSIQNYGNFDHFFQLYSECMLAVDESVGKITQTLEDLGELQETIIIYFSDNGYMMGEHGLIDKRVMYEESIRVPCFVFCPELIPEPRESDKFVLNIDLAPSILDMAGVKIPKTMHGMSFFPIVKGLDKPWREGFLYEYFIDPNAVQTPTIFGVRNQEYSYMSYHGIWDVYELYNMQDDSKQMANLLGDIEYGRGYGSFLRHVQKQKPELYSLVQELEEELEELLAKSKGTRTPRWTFDKEND